MGVLSDGPESRPGQATVAWAATTVDAACCTPTSRVVVACFQGFPLTPSPGRRYKHAPPSLSYVSGTTCSSALPR